ncbi:MAG: hypothetical protein H6737_06810 [Alphaproteobacteria bacterium]|nr:hypothetical protein [Alphaproteobacteria bacterium]
MPPVPEIVVLCGELLLAGRFVVMALVGVLAAASVWAWRRGAPGPRLAAWVLVPAFAWGLYAAWQQRAVFDDAYISFRYVANLVNGEGLVFNPGEYVEGYSNPLWVFLVALGHVATGLEIPLVAVALDLAVYLALGAVAYGVSRGLSGDRPGWLPLAPAVIVAERAVAAFATTGMETLLGALLALGAMGALVRPTPRRAGLAGLLLALGIVHRLDHAVFWCAGLAAVAVATVSVSPRERLVWLGSFVAPTALVVAHLAWKLAYYGDVLPNTFYAKASDGFAAERGFVYLWTFVFGSLGFVAIPLFVAWLWEGARDARSRVPAVYAGLSAGAWLLYLLYVGGDFMYARFCLPVFPIVVVGAGAAVWRMAADGRQLVAAGLLASMAGGVTILPPGPRKWGQIEENRAYPLEGLFPVVVDHASYWEGTFFKQVFTDRGIDVYLSSCCVGMLTYYSEQRMLDTHGLTDAETAHLPRGRIAIAGHEKSLPVPEVRARGVQIGRWHNRDPLPFRPVTRVRFPGQPAHIRRVYAVVTWDPALMARIREEVPEVDITDFPTWLDGYIAELPQRRPAEVEADLEFLRPFYFDHVEDPARLAPIEARAGRAAREP